MPKGLGMYKGLHWTRECEAITSEQLWWYLLLLLHLPKRPL